MFNPIVAFNNFRLLCDNDYLVANVPSIHGIYVLLLNFIRRKPICVEVAADEDQFASKKGGELLTFLIKPFFKYFTFNARGAAYVSNYLREKFKTKGSAIVSSNVNINDVVSYSYVADRLEKLTDKEKVIRVGFVGGLNQRKGLQILLPAFSELLKYHNNIELVIVGGHSDRD